MISDGLENAYTYYTNKEFWGEVTSLNSFKVLDGKYYEGDSINKVTRPLIA
jgi:hypothetical protein